MDITLQEAGRRYIEAFERALENRGKRLKNDSSQKKRRANEVLSSGDGNSDTYVSENTLRVKYAPAIKLLCDENDLGAKLLSNITRSDLEEHLNFLDLAISTYNDRVSPSDNHHVSRLGKRRKRHQPTIAWPSDAEFVRMIAEMSNVKIAEKLNCTEAAVRKERKKRKI